MIIRSPETSSEWEAYYDLRFEVLRKPWGQPSASSKVEDDENAFHWAAFSKDQKLVGCCRLNKDKEKSGQIRFMAVHPTFQGQGIGKLLLTQAEAFAKTNGIYRIWMNARENAIPFYTNCGYHIIGEGPTLWGQIPHKVMEKILSA